MYASTPPTPPTFFAGLAAASAPPVIQRESDSDGGSHGNDVGQRIMELKAENLAFSSEVRSLQRRLAEVRSQRGETCQLPTGASQVEVPAVISASAALQQPQLPSAALPSAGLPPEGAVAAQRSEEGAPPPAVPQSAYRELRASADASPPVSLQAVGLSPAPAGSPDISQLQSENNRLTEQLVEASLESALHFESFSNDRNALWRLAQELRQKVQSEQAERVKYATMLKTAQEAIDRLAEENLQLAEALVRQQTAANSASTVSSSLAASPAGSAPPAACGLAAAAPHAAHAPLQAAASPAAPSLAASSPTAGAQPEASPISVEASPSAGHLAVKTGAAPTPAAAALGNDAQPCSSDLQKYRSEAQALAKECGDLRQFIKQQSEQANATILELARRNLELEERVQVLSRRCPEAGRQEHLPGPTSATLAEAASAAAASASGAASERSASASLPPALPATSGLVTLPTLHVPAVPPAPGAAPASTGSALSCDDCSSRQESEVELHSARCIAASVGTFSMGGRPNLANAAWPQRYASNTASGSHLAASPPAYTPGSSRGAMDIDLASSRDSLHHVRTVAPRASSPGSPCGSPFLGSDGRYTGRGVAGMTAASSSSAGSREQSHHRGGKGRVETLQRSLDQLSVKMRRMQETALSAARC
eukprot:TRINITY_DN65565_c0_g1_i1.p1 TRINITY_DN65565_c0_g1~~TRINITY_DN65565_c0_g1_i1.p1  ORF type:complete len:655 (+),score=168.76 TRINITY_DN65565_c0_g1_i1:124-2088(+)